MAKTLELKEATEIITQINTLDAKLVSMIDMYDKTMANYDSNIIEINRLENLKKSTDELKKKSMAIKAEVENIKGEINDKRKQVTEAGWVVPLPERKIQASAMRI